MPIPRDEYDFSKPIMPIRFHFVGDDLARDCHPCHLLIKEKASQRISPFAPTSFPTAARRLSLVKA